MGVKITAALSAIYTAGGGTVDARGFVCPTSCHIGTADLSVGDGTHPITLLLPTGTITRDTVSGLGRSAQIVLKSHAHIFGQGKSATIISGPSDVTAVQQASNAGNGISDIEVANLSIQDSGTAVGGSAAFMVGGPNADGSTGEDVLSSEFWSLNISGADIGTLIDGQHGCICYNKWFDVNSSGHSFGVKTMNDSGWSFGFNSSQWYSGNFGGPIGLFDSGGGKDTFYNPDLENNKSNNGGGVLAAQVTNQGAGSGYVQGDVVTATAGCTVNPTLTVLHVGAGGVVGIQGHPALSVATAGSGCPTHGTNVATTGGTGTGLKVDFQTSASIVEIANSDVIIGMYEEASDPDFFCGTGNEVALGSFFSSNGAIYQPNYCFGQTADYGGPKSNFLWGPGSTPGSVGLSGASPYVAMGSNGMYDAYLETKGPLQSSANGVNLWADGPAYNGWIAGIYGPYGHSDWNVGISKPHAGVVDTGRMTVSRLPTPTVPTVTIGAGSAGTATYTYGFACTSDGNGGVPSPGPISSAVTGPDVLGAWLTATPVVAGTGYVVNDVVTVTGGSGTAQLTVTSIGAGGAVTGLSVTTPGSGYRLIGQFGAGTQTVYSTTGGTGTGLTVTGTATYMSVAFTPPDGCKTFVILKGDSSHQMVTTSAVGWNSLVQAWFDFGAATTTYSAPTRDSTGDMSVAGLINGISLSTGSSAPTGSCTSPAIYLTTAGALYNCQSGAWVAK